MKLARCLYLAVGAFATFDDDASSGSTSSSSTSSTASPGSCNACQFIEGFVQAYVGGQMTCGSELTDFEGGANDILSGLTSMVGSSTPSSNGWSSISSGFSEIESGLSSCAEQSWWGDFESDVENVFEDLVPEVKLVADAYEIVVNGYNIYSDLKNAYSDCEGGEWNSCGSDMGSLVSTLKSSGVLLATSKSDIQQQCLNQCCGATPTAKEDRSLQEDDHHDDDTTRYDDTDVPADGGQVHDYSNGVDPTHTFGQDNDVNLASSSSEAEAEAEAPYQLAGAAVDLASTCVLATTAKTTTSAAFQTCQARCGVVDTSSDSSSSDDTNNVGVIAAAAIGSLAVVGGVALFVRSRQISATGANEEGALQMVLIEDEVRL